jgi:DNA-binding beta-propeller fold protein YncE
LNVIVVPRRAAAFVNFETGQVRPLALSPDGSTLLAINTPDGRLEILDVSGGMSRPSARSRGLEPVAVAARTNTEVWVVNHLSDSVSIVDIGVDAAARRADAAGRRRAARHRLRRPDDATALHPRLHHHRAPRAEPSRLRPAAI